MSDTLDQFARDLRHRLRQSEAEGFSVWPDPEFHAWALRLFHLQCEFNEPYGAWCRALGPGARGASDWRSFPAVPTEAFKLLDLSGLPPGERAVYFQSSGTSGNRASRHFHSDASLALYCASLRPWFHAHLLTEPPDPATVPTFLNLCPPPGACPHSSLVHMFADVTAQFGADDSVFAGRVAPDGAWELDWDRALPVLERSLPDNRPLAILGTAFSFVHLTDELVLRNLHYPVAPGSTVMETGGYKGRSRVVSKAELHGVIRHRLGLAESAIVTEYGMCELGSQAYDRVARTKSAPGGPDPRRFHFPPWCQMAVVSPETGVEMEAGGIGLVRVFDLANVCSAAAVQTGDAARDWPGGFELLGRALDLEPRGCSLLAA